MICCFMMFWILLHRLENSGTVAKITILHSFSKPIALFSYIFWLSIAFPKSFKIVVVQWEQKSSGYLFFLDKLPSEFCVFKKNNTVALKFVKKRRVCNLLKVRYLGKSCLWFLFPSLWLHMEWRRDSGFVAMANELWRITMKLKPDCQKISIAPLLTFFAHSDGCWPSRHGAFVSRWLQNQSSVFGHIILHGWGVRYRIQGLAG